jgi:hypothetical protein
MYLRKTKKSPTKPGVNSYVIGTLLFENLGFQRQDMGMLFRIRRYRI